MYIIGMEQLTYELVRHVTEKSSPGLTVAADDSMLVLPVAAGIEVGQFDCATWLHAGKESRLEGHLALIEHLVRLRPGKRQREGWQLSSAAGETESVRGPSVSAWYGVPLSGGGGCDVR